MLCDVSFGGRDDRVRRIAVNPTRLTLLMLLLLLLLLLGITTTTITTSTITTTTATTTTTTTTTTGLTRARTGGMDVILKGGG